jgi:hypothetical protein
LQKIENKIKRGVILTPFERRELKFIKVKQQLLEKYKVKNLSIMQVRYLEKGIENIVYYDIETSDFNPYQNFIICYCAEIRNILTGKITKYEYSITKNDIHKAVDLNTFDFDHKLLQHMSKVLHSGNMIIGHYASKFDLGYFTARCLLTNQDELKNGKYGELVQADTWRMMKNTLKAPRNTLNNLILITTGKSQKTHVDLKYWYTIRFPKNENWQKSMNYIVDHCRKDVTMTRKAHMKIEKFNPISGMLV